MRMNELHFLLCFIVLISKLNSEIPCNTPACQEDDRLFSQYIDSRAQPCTNFYQYACGQWLSKNSQGTQIAASLKHLSDSERWKKIYYLKHGGRSSSQAVMKVKEIYKQCLNLGLIDSKDLAPIKEMFINYQLSFPAMHCKFRPWNHGQYNIHAEMFRYSSIGLSAFVKYDTFLDLFYQGKRALSVDIDPLLTGDMKDYESNENSVRQFLTSILTIFNNDAHQVATDVQGIMEFDKAAIAIKKKFKITRAKLTMSELSARNQAIITKLHTRVDINFIPYWVENMFRYMQSRRQPLSNKLMRGITVENEIAPQLEILIGNSLFTEVGRRAVANKAAINALINLKKFLPSRLQNLIFNYFNKFHDPPKPREENCLGLMRSAESRVYLDGLNYQRYRFIEVMMQNIKAQMLERINRATFLDKFSKDSCYKKIKAIKDIQGYEDWIRKDKILDTLYRNVVVNPDPMKSYLSVLQANAENDFLYLDPKRALPKDDIVSSLPGGSVSQTNMKFVVNAAMYNPPFYREGTSVAINYGAIGFVTAHELSHAIDSVGALFDHNGVYRKTWSASSMSNYQVQMKCVENQYSSYFVNAIGGRYNVNGKQTLMENIADLTGIQVAYDAFKVITKRYPKLGLTLPNQHYSADQLFFLAFARQHCAYVPLNKVESVYATDGHSPPEIRVTGCLTGFQPFLNAFGCDKVRSMYNQPSCKVWT